MYHDKLTDYATVEVIKQKLSELDAIRDEFQKSYRSIEILIDEIQDEENNLTYSTDGVLEKLEDTCDSSRIAAESMDEICTGLDAILDNVTVDEE